MKFSLITVASVASATSTAAPETTTIATTTTTPATESWEKHESTNCYKGHGSFKDIDTKPMPGVNGVEECEAQCDLHQQCYAALVDKDGGCQRRGPFKLEQCDSDADYALYERKGPHPTHTTTTTTPPHTKDILMGVWLGLLSDTDDMDICIIDGISGVGSLMDAVKKFKDGKVPEAFADLSDAFGQVEPLVADCNVVNAEMRKFFAAVKHISPATAEANFKAHRTEILEAVGQASKCRDAEDWNGMGMQLGIALRKVLEEDSVVV